MRLVDIAAPEVGNSNLFYSLLFSNNLIMVRSIARKIKNK